MQINTSDIVTFSEASQNFNQVTRIADSHGQAVIFKDDRPKYLLLDLDAAPPIEMSEDERIDFVANRILREHRAAFEELAK